MSNSQKPWGGNNDERVQTPPDLDEAINELKSKFNAFFGSKKNDDADIIDGNSNKFNSKFKYIFILAIILWLASGFYIIDPAEKGVVLRFGVLNTVVDEGPYWHMPYPIDKVEVVNVSEVRITEIGFRTLVNSSGSKFTRNVLAESIMLTSDGNIVDASFEVQYIISDAKYYLFNIKNPEKTLEQIANSVIREVVGKYKIDYIITEGRASISNEIKIKSQELLDFYKVGLHINTINFKSAQAPAQVQAAYSDVTKAKTDKQRYINEAQSYANDILPKARGKSARVLEEANAYKAEVIARAEGEANRFLQILTEYERAIIVTKERLYRQTMEDVFSKTSKVITSGSNNSLMYLPIDKLIQRVNANNEDDSNDYNNSNNTQNNSVNIRNAFRNRGSN